MNLYALHTKPRQLFGGEGDLDSIPIISDLLNYRTSNDEFFEETIINRIKLLDRRVPEIEQAILNMGEMGVYLMGYYAENIIEDRWKEAEPIIMQSDYWEDYQLEFGIQ